MIHKYKELEDYILELYLMTKIYNMDELFKTVKGLMIMAVVLIVIGLLFYAYSSIIGSVIMFIGALVGSFAVFGAMGKSK